ncbi:hypothetical protein ELI43_23775 [Rhizobium leguminosarum]|nr:hypothetical protein ELI43_23775 [Rhizobium leguminosarum]
MTRRTASSISCFCNWYSLPCSYIGTRSGTVMRTPPSSRPAVGERRVFLVGRQSPCLRSPAQRLLIWPSRAKNERNS